MADISRRHLIEAGAAAIAAGALGVGAPVVGAPAVAQAADPTYTAYASLYTRRRFALKQGKGFSICRNRTGTPVVLTEVADLPGGKPGSPTRFRLTFRVRGTEPLPPQATYTLRRRNFAPTSLFLVPTPGRRSMTAIIDSGR